MSEDDRLVRLKRIERAVIVSAWLFASGFTLLLLAAKWPRYWAYVAPEQTPMTWLQSVLLFACMLLGLLSFTLAYAEEGWSRRAGVWLVVTAAYLFLALDERFALHERVRDNVLAPRDIKLLPWMGAGDFLLLLYAIAGLLFVSELYKVLRSRRAAWRWFRAAAVLALAAVGADSVDVARMTEDGERVEQTLEEIVELAAMAAFFSSYLLMLTDGLKRWLVGPS